MLALFILQDTASRFGIESILPSSVLGWLSVVTAGGLLIDRIRNRGKKEGVDEATINGLGARVRDVETNHERLEGQFLEHQRTVDRILAQNGQLLTEIGRAERSAGQCREDTERYTLEIGSKVDTLRREVLAELGSARTDFSERTGKIEVDIGKLTTEVKLRAEFDARDDRNQRG